ncbi:MAG: hypothetical protein ACYCSA_04885 [Thermoplasmataceae archaeon]
MNLLTYEGNLGKENIDRIMNYAMRLINEVSGRLRYQNMVNYRKC